MAWDVDGTLVDSEPLHHHALVQASKVFGVDFSDLPDQAYRGVHMQDVWLALRHRLPANLDREDWLSAIGDYYVRHKNQLVAENGAVQTIKTLHARGIVQACVSNSERRIVEANLEALDVARYMSSIISLDDVENGKPMPEPYSKACFQLDLPPGQVLAVEDSMTGLTSALAAGLKALFYGKTNTPLPSGAIQIDNIASVLRVMAV